MKAIRIARYIKLGVNPLPHAIDEMEFKISVLVDEVIVQVDLHEEEINKKMANKLKRTSSSK